MKTLIKLGYIAILIIGILGASYFAVNVIGAFQSGAETFKLNYELITEDITGTGVVYTPQCFTTCHLPINFSYSGSAAPTSKILGVTDFTYTLNKIVQDDDVNVVGINLLVNKTFTKDIWSSNVTCMSVFNATINAINENCFDNPFKTSQQLWRWDWEPISNVNLTKGNWYVIDFVGKRTPKQEIFATDIIPSINSVSMPDLAWWNGSCSYRYPVISNATYANTTFVINDTVGINSGQSVGSMIMTKNSTEPIYAYFQNTDYTGFCGVGNQTDTIGQKNWENATTITGNDVRSLWNDVGATLGVWHSDKTSEALYDSSAKGLNGTYVGSVTNGTGVFGNAINFTGGYADLGSGAYSSSDYSNGAALSFWFNAHNAGGSDRVMFMLNSGWGIYLSTGALQMFFNAKSGQNTKIMNLPNNHQWYYVTVTCDNTNIFFYVNATYMAKAANSCGPDSFGGGVKIGANWDGTMPYGGAFDEFRQYNRNLTETELQEMFRNGVEKLGYPVNNLTALGPMDTLSSIYLEETSGRTEMINGIKHSLGSDAVIYTDQQIYVRYVNTTQQLGRFDKVTKYGNQIWAFNYVNDTTPLTNMQNITPAFYVFEMGNKTTGTIETAVSNLINVTKAS